MNMFARFDENPALALHDIKKTKRYGRTHGRTDKHCENSIPTTNKVCGGLKSIFFRKTPTSPWVQCRAQFQPIGQLFCLSRPLAYSLQYLFQVIQLF